MRFKLTLQIQPNTGGTELPISYQYELSATIYNILSRSNTEYSYWLHENGFRTDNKCFKLFTFSHLIVPRHRIDKEHHRLILQCNTVEWYISFLPEKSTQSFIEGVFMEQSFQVVDKISTVEFKVKSVEVLPALAYKEEMCFETLSPICISKRRENGGTDYLSPSDPTYASAILTGLLARYKAFYGKDYSGALFLDFHVLTEPKSVLITIKANTPQQIYTRGYKYKFKIRLPEELMKIMYEAGAGEKTSMGWGCLKSIPLTK